MSTDIVSNARREYIEGLRKLADLLDATPDLPTPFLSGDTITWSDYYDAAEVARLSSLVPGRMLKNDPNEGGYDATYYRLTSNVKYGPFKLVVSSYRSTVCEKVQTGTKVVEVPPVEAAPGRVEEVPVFEYVCSPLLAKAVGA
jgi:hypothetical protein